MPEPDIFRMASQFRQALLRQERAASAEMIRIYGEVWRRIKRDLDAITAQIEEAEAEGLVPDTFRPRQRDGLVIPRTPGTHSPSWLFQQDRLQSLERQLEAELRRLAQLADGAITAQQRQAVEAAQAHSEQLAMAGLGEPPPGVTVTWTRLPREALTDLVGFLQDGSPLRDLLDEIGPEVSAGFRKALITGVATGQNPRTIARQVRQEIGGGLARTLTICRTETIRAYRESALRGYQANSDVVKGWIWHSALGERTCEACWAMHGTKHRLDERLDDHPNGRCSAIPLTATWADILGKEKAKGIPDTRAQVERGTDIFQRLSEPEQRQILGPAAFAAYKAGAVKLSDFVGRKRSKRWGTMRYSRSLSDILGPKQAEKWMAEAVKAQ